MTQKISELEKKLTDHNHDKCISSKKFNKLTAENFATRLAQANLITKTDFDNCQNCQVLTKKLLQIKQDIYSLKMSWKN